MNFKEYIDNYNVYLTENNPTLNDLIDNFKKVFPYSKENNLKINHFNIEGDKTNDLSAHGQVSSETSNDRYDCFVKCHRDDNTLPFSVKNIGKVSCSCNAYRYNLSHPNTKNNAQVEPIPNYASISNTVRNPDKNVGVCKHLFAFLHFLYNKGIIRNN